MGMQAGRIKKIHPIVNSLVTANQGGASQGAGRGMIHLPLVEGERGLAPP